MPKKLTHFCVYTIRHSADLAKRDCKGPFHEKRAWVTAKRLLAEAVRDGERLPVIFCPAETTDRLFAWAVLESIDITPGGTDYTFSNLKHLDGKPHPKSSLKKRNQETLSEKGIIYMTTLEPVDGRGALR